MLDRARCRRDRRRRSSRSPRRTVRRSKPLKAPGPRCGQADLRYLGQAGVGVDRRDRPHGLGRVGRVRLLEVHQDVAAVRVGDRPPGPLSAQVLIRFRVPSARRRSSVASVSLTVVNRIEPSAWPIGSSAPAVPASGVRARRRVDEGEQATGVDVGGDDRRRRQGARGVDQSAVTRPADPGTAVSGWVVVLTGTV